MDELIKAFKLDESLTSVVDIWSLIIGVLLSAVLALGVGVIYRRVHGEADYSQSLVHTFVLVSMITALIMLVIGSNIARAFSLVGALSIIRFRTAIKNPLDVGFVFLAMAIGMAAGTRFYAVAVVGTILIGSVMLLMHHFNYGSFPARKEFLLSAVFQLNVNYEEALTPLLEAHFDAYSFAYAETIKQGTLREVVYSVRPRGGVSDQAIVDAVRQANDNLKVSYRTVRHAMEIP